MEEMSAVGEAIAYCDAKNAEAGLKRLKWLQITPEDDPDNYVGINPETSEITGPGIHIGHRYRIIYSLPVRLPFKEEGEGDVAFHVIEIEGTLKNLFWLLDVKGIICQPDDYSVKMPMRASKSIFRFFIGDKLEPI